MSNRFPILILFLLTSFSLRCFPQNLNTNERLRKIIREYGQAEVTVPYAGIKSVDILTHNVSILSVKDKIVHISLSPLTLEWFLLQKFDYQIIDRADFKGIISANSLTKAMEWDTYPTYSQYDSIMQSFINLYPGLCHLDTIGTSINGKLVLALKISDNADDDEDEPEVFYSSTIHGDETGGFIIMLRLIDYLLKNYNLNDRVTNIVDELEIWINPLANPDGTYKEDNVISSSSTRNNANGIDLNRNFPDPDYPAIVQQKETLDMMKFLRNHKFVLSANFHAGVEVVNYPWDRWSRLHPDDDWFYNISRKYADTVHLNSGTGYMTFMENGITNGYKWYQINGGRQDFVTYELQGREVTIELDNNYITPVTQLNSLWESNWRSLLGYLENTFYGIHGFVRDAITNAPVSAKILVMGHDADRSYVYSDSLSGSFVRLIVPGTWNLLFSANGYCDTLVRNVFVAENQKTDLLVDMKLNTNFNHVDTTTNRILELYPNPANTFIKVVTPDILTGTVNVKIFSSSGRLMLDYNTVAVRGVPNLIDVKGLSGGIYTIVFTNTLARSSFRGRFVVVK